MKFDPAEIDGFCYSIYDPARACARRPKIIRDKRKESEAMGECTWKKKDGRWQCQAVKCEHWKDGGVCGLGKVSLTCDNNDCKWNVEIIPGVYACQSMDVHLDADGNCLGKELNAAS